MLQISPTKRNNYFIQSKKNCPLRVALLFLRTSGYCWNILCICWAKEEFECKKTTNKFDLKDCISFWWQKNIYLKKPPVAINEMTPKSNARAMLKMHETCIFAPHQIRNIPLEEKHWLRWGERPWAAKL